jgi:hypothetical protein
MSVKGPLWNKVQEQLNGGKTDTLFQAFEDKSLDHDARINALEHSLLDFGLFLSTSWNISTLATCPTGKLIVSSICTSLGSRRKSSQISPMGSYFWPSIELLRGVNSNSRA